MGKREKKELKDFFIKLDEDEEDEEDEEELDDDDFFIIKEKNGVVIKVDNLKEKMEIKRAIWMYKDLFKRHKYHKLWYR